MSNRWLYKVIEVKPRFIGVRPADIEAVLAPLGHQGWELVSVVHSGLVALLYLKKPQ